MNNFFYARIALNNIRKNAKTFIPYLLTCIGTIAMFYNMCFLVVAKDIGSVSDSGTVRYLLFLGAVVIGIFSVIFLFYTNSFLIKRRKKEFGLFNILGMEKKHIARIMFLETLYTAIISLGAGLLAGILFSKLMILLLLKIISFEATFGFEIPMRAIFWTLGLFGGISLLNLLYNIFQVYFSKPVELLKGGNAGEKEPKTRWILAVFGAICLSLGYYISLTTETPLEALYLFFIAVILVIMGTYSLFTAGSIAILKRLRRNKKYYYQLNHFISVSGMIYRMKQNAAGLANICILSTAVIIMLSTTLSLYVGMEDVLRTRFPRNILVHAVNVSDEQAAKLDDLMKEQVEKANILPEDVIRYRMLSYGTIQKDAGFTGADSTSFSARNFAMVEFLTLDDYNRMENKSVSLSSNEVLLYPLRGDIPGDVVSINGLELTIKDRLSSLFSESEISGELTNTYFFVVKDMHTIQQIYHSLSGNDLVGLSYDYGFDVSSGKDAQINLIAALNKEIRNLGVEGYAQGPEGMRASFYALYGGLFFLGIFLGLLFIMATVLIIYYKQISEGYDDKERFEIMQKVGMSPDEVKGAIRSQVLTVFFLPLATAVIHIVFAFKVITKLLSVFSLTNIPLFAICTVITILVFAVFYAWIYTLTARTYYKIVS